MEYMFSLAIVVLLVPGSAVHEERVREFWGQGVVILEPSNSVKLSWYILPGNATVYWVRCYVGETANANKHFYTYNYNSGDYWQGGALATRSISHSVRYLAHRPIVFSLILEHPVEEDSGMYMCELEGWGMSEPRPASLRLRVFVQPRQNALSRKAHSIKPTHPVTDRTSDITKLSFDYDINLTTSITTPKYTEGNHSWSPWIIFVAVMSFMMFMFGCVAISKLIMLGNLPVLRYFKRKDDVRIGTFKYKAALQDGITDRAECSHGESLQLQDNLMDV